jgi:predicted acylesterase/phospholipase RssA
MVHTQHIISVTYSQAAQRAAILAGLPAAQVQSYEVDAALLPRLLALPWTEVSTAGVASCHVPPGIPYSREEAEQGERRQDSWRRGGYYGQWDGGTVAAVPLMTAEEAIHHGELVVAQFKAHLKEQHAQCQAAKAQKDVEQAEREARYSALVEEWLALPKDRQVTRCHPGSRTDFRFRTTLRSTAPSLPPSYSNARLKAREAELESYMAELQADLEEITAAQDAAWLKACCAYVEANVPEYARAAREGRDVSRQARDAFAAQVAARLAEHGFTVLDTYCLRSQDVPTTHAYEVLDEVRSVLKDLPALPATITTEIQRGDTEFSKGSETWRTIVEVTIAYPDDTSDAVSVLAEVLTDDEEVVS